MTTQVATRFLEAHERVKHGKNREAQIADALIEQCGVKLEDATDVEDKTFKVDRWLVEGTKRTAVQIKYRETGDDLLFEVFDRFTAWHSRENKIGRDMKGNSKLYAVLRQDRKTVVMTHVDVAKKIISDMQRAAQVIGWTKDEGPQRKVLKYNKNGGTCELRVQRDPGDGRTKMVAYIPAAVLQAEAQTQVYQVNMPKDWK